LGSKIRVVAKIDRRRALGHPCFPRTRTVLTMVGRLAIIAITLPVVLALILSGADLTLAWLVKPLDPGVKLVFRAISWLGDSTVYLVGTALAFVALRFVRRSDALWPFALYAFCSLAASGIAVYALKVAFGRTRPGSLFEYDRHEFILMTFNGSTQSFPSGHSAIITTAAVLLALLTPRLIPLYAAIAVTVAASRLLITYHFLSDVLAGLLLGVMIPLYLRDWFRQRPWWREPWPAPASPPLAAPRAAGPGRAAERGR
jgi:membrane-associated phospholipid phosphatase